MPNRFLHTQLDLQEKEKKNGEQYNFISKREYLTLLNDDKLMACSKIEKDFYGMPLLEDILQEGDNIDYLIDMGVSGGRKISASNYDLFDSRNARAIINAKKQ